MSGIAVHFSSQTAEWATPQDYFDTVDREFGFDLDVCALPDNAKCERYFTPDDDGLAQAWTGTVWMNPPYGRQMAKWIRKAWESAQAGATVVCLVPARTDTGWWWDYCRYGEVRFIRGRLKFGGSDTSAPFPNALVIFRGVTAIRYCEACREPLLSRADARYCSNACRQRAYRERTRAAR